MLIIDTENTFHNKGNPFDARNFNVCISYAYRDKDIVAGCLFDDKDKIKDLIAMHDTLVFFNAKYDLHWLRKLGISFKNKRIWCCQLFEFLHSRQTKPFPSLEDTAVNYGLGHKLDVIATEYWNKGINTDLIPRELLAEYAVQDARLTLKIYEEQCKIQKPHQVKLFSISMQDLAVLAEMEWNGLYYNKKKSLEKAKELETEISSIQHKLDLYHNIPCFNWASNDHLSSLLYGGEIEETIRVPNGVYKTGKKAGEVKYKIETKTYVLPRIYKPIKGSELKKENKWSVEEQYLLQLKGSEELITGILRIKELEKLRSTYLIGLPTLNEKMYWEENVLHGQFNQCITRTGRLSCSNPNLQNLSDKAQEFFETRWKKK
jgi:DNA polymerase-1